MKRADFLKTLGLGASGLILPKMGIVQEPIKVYENYIRGITYYKFNELSTMLKSGSAVELTREYDNLYDVFAIAVHFNNQKLGYLPAYENVVLANLIDKGVRLHAFVGKIDKHQLSVEIFAELVVNSTPIISINDDLPADDAQDFYRRSTEEY